MKLARNLYLTVTGIIACGLLAAGIAVALANRYDFADNWRIAASTCCLGGAVGVIGLGWYWLRLTGGITSIAGRLKTGLTAEDADEKIKVKNSVLCANSAVIRELSEAVGSCLDGNANRMAALEKQIRDLEIQVQLSQRQKRNADAIIYSIRDAVLVVDEFDRLLMANEAAGKLFNFDFKNSQHKPIGELITRTGGRYGEFVDFLRQSGKSKVRATRREFEFSGNSPAGEGPKTFDCIVSCVYDEKSQVCGIVAVFHDITREKEISKMKSDFVSHVSHELKTPLASITAYSEMLADGEADDEQTRKEFYSIIQSQAKRLNRLIEDILNISRIESGLVKVDKKPVSLTVLIEEQLQMIKGCAEEKNIEVICPKLIVFDQVYGDRDMISQVIVNLLSNAVKYTNPGGSIRIDSEVDEIAGVARVSITDTGVGIPENEIEHVFDKFYRVEANKNVAKGTGLGLNLVRQIVEKIHNGRVFVTSKTGVGSTFGFELPLARTEAVRAV